MAEDLIRQRARIVVFLRQCARDLEAVPIPGIVPDQPRADELRGLAQRLEDCAESEADHHRIGQILDAMLLVAKIVAST